VSKKSFPEVGDLFYICPSGDEYYGIATGYYFIVETNKTRNKVVLDRRWNLDLEPDNIESRTYYFVGAIKDKHYKLFRE
jgi:hypothetical protein